MKPGFDPDGHDGAMYSRNGLTNLITMESIVSCQRKMVGRVIGPKGATIKSIKAESGAKIDVKANYTIYHTKCSPITPST